MLRIHQLRLPLDAAESQETLRAMCAKTLRVSVGKVESAVLVKRSVDARDKEDVHFSLTVDCALTGGEAQERSLAGKFKPNQIAFFAASEKPKERDVFHLPLAPWPQGKLRPIVVGAGPAGLFCALTLAVRGARPILLERGQPVEKRAQDVDAFAQAGILDPESNALFGEGGAGAFSDGKLTCGLGSPHIRTVLSTLAACGAPEDILVSQRPHIGTDELRRVLVTLRERLIALGGEVRFGHLLTGIEMKSGKVAALRVTHENREEDWDADTVCLAIGHSARDTYVWLHAMGMPMAAKPFAVGCRVEHLQREISRGQYGGVWEHPALPPAEYKLNVPTPDGRGVYTFCMCPGGQVIGAVNEPGTVGVNGMSLHARSGINANSALLVGVTPADFGSDHPLAGVAFQRHIEEAAFEAFGGYLAPCQRVGDLLAKRPSGAFGQVLPSYRPGVRPGDIACCLPSFVMDNLRYALPRLGQKLRGFDAPDALLTAPETRSSSPVRLMRNQRRESPLRGIHPLGEGAGYAGGIVSAAVDGLCAGLDIGT